MAKRRGEERGRGKKGRGRKGRIGEGRRFRGCWGRTRERNSERIGRGRRGRRGGIKGRGSPNYCATGDRHMDEADEQII